MDWRVRFGTLMRFDSTLEITAAPERVFAYLTEPELVKTWQLDLRELEPLPEGGLRIGARQRATVKEYGQQFEVETVVADFRINEFLAYEMHSPNATVTTEFCLVRSGDTTSLRQTVIVVPRGLMRLLLPLVQRVFLRKVRSRLQLLKEKAEAANSKLVSQQANDA